MSALAAVLTAAVPSLVSSPALAEKAPEKSPEGASAGTAGTSGTPGASTAKDAKAEPTKAEPKRATKAHHAKKAHPLAKQETSAKPESVQKPEEAKAGKDAKAAAATAPKGKKAKKTASRTGTKGKKTAKKADPPRRRCLGTPLAIDRSGLEAQSLTLVDCHDRPVEDAQVALSVLARPWGAPKPDHVVQVAPLSSAASPHEGAGKVASKGGVGVGAGARPGEVAPGVRLLDKGLLSRLDAVAHRFQGKPISLVSGYRPQSRGSQHQSARALDLRVLGVPNEELVAFCKTLPDTGCGYYPNSSFVHFDVRNPGTGGVNWIDASGPGESPRYVHQWPPLPGEADAAAPDTEPHEGAAETGATEPADEAASGPSPSIFEDL